MIIEYFNDIFQYDEFPVEYECYKALQHEDINYIAIPWTQILNSHWLNFPNKHPKSYYFQFLSNQTISQTNNITVCQHDSYMQLHDIFKHLNITKVFSPLHDKNNHLDDIDILPISFTFKEKFTPTEKRRLFSFVGTYDSHPIRNVMKDILHGDNIIYRDSYHIEPEIYTHGKSPESLKRTTEYKTILQESVFSLCPRGTSPSSTRFWESLQAGAIPILISDDWVLPKWDWDNTVITIKEEMVPYMTYDLLEKQLSNISNDRILQLRNNCLLANKTFNSDNYKEYIKGIINE